MVTLAGLREPIKKDEVIGPTGGRKYGKKKKRKAEKAARRRNHG